MVQRRSITSHPLFAPLIALWFAALLGLTIVVLPAAVHERALAAMGLSGLLPLTSVTRIALAAAVAALGALAGRSLARWIARRAARDPRPIYAEAEPAYEAPVEEPRRRRPLHVREELEGGFGDESQVIARTSAAPRIFVTQTQPQDGFMILTPQPIHPPRPEPDLEALLAQFDAAFVAFRDGEEALSHTAVPPPGADPVQAFVARQTGASPPALAASRSPLGGLVPDHQAELRAALDKLAQSQGRS